MGNYSENLKRRVINRGNKIGHCVICGEHGKLSRDHVPPKACNNLNDVELRSLYPSHDIKEIATTSQGGSHYKTLCEECNNTRLGQYYVPYLVSLSNEITSLVLGAKNQVISLPQELTTIIRPQRIARAVVGHCLAAIAVNETKTGLVSSPISDALREYFLTPDLPMPEELTIYYWPYPSKRQVVVKHMGKSSIHDKGVIYGHVIEFLP